MALAGQGEWDGAAGVVQDGLAGAEGIPYRFAEARLRQTWGEVLSAQGETEGAREELGRAEAIFGRLGPRSLISWNWRLGG
jgi:hypothetical protein